MAKEDFDDPFYIVTVEYMDGKIEIIESECGVDTADNVFIMRKGNKETAVPAFNVRKITEEKR